MIAGGDKSRTWLAQQVLISTVDQSQQRDEVFIYTDILKTDNEVQKLENHPYLNISA